MPELLADAVELQLASEDGDAILDALGSPLTLVEAEVDALGLEELLGPEETDARPVALEDPLPLVEPDTLPLGLLEDDGLAEFVLLGDPLLVALAEPVVDALPVEDPLEDAQPLVEALEEGDIDSVGDPLTDTEVEEDPVEEASDERVALGLGLPLRVDAAVPVRLAERLRLGVPDPL